MTDPITIERQVWHDALHTITVLSDILRTKQITDEEYTRIKFLLSLWYEYMKPTQN